MGSIGVGWHRDTWYQDLHGEDGKRHLEEMDPCSRGVFAASDETEGADEEHNGGDGGEEEKDVASYEVALVVANERHGGGSVSSSKVLYS